MDFLYNSKQDTHQNNIITKWLNNISLHGDITLEFHAFPLRSRNAPTHDYISCPAVEFTWQNYDNAVIFRYAYGKKRETGIFVPDEGKNINTAVCVVMNRELQKRFCIYPVSFEWRCNAILLLSTDKLHILCVLLFEMDIQSAKHPKSNSRIFN